MNTFRLSSRWLVLLVPALAMALGGGSPVAAQETGAAAPTFESEISVSWVLVPMVARSRQGEPRRLDENDVRLYVDGRRIAVESFDAGVDAPLSLLVLQDLSGSMATQGKLDESRRALASLLARVGANDEIALATFAGGQVQMEVPFTGNASALAGAINDWQPYGTTTLHDAVALGPDLAAGARHANRGVVLLTDGGDNASALPPAATRELIRTAQLPFYVLDLSPPAIEPGDSDSALLEELAVASGGRYFAASGAEAVRGAATALLDELRYQVVVGFAVAGEPVTHRRIEVEVAGRSRNRLIYRRSYRGGPPLEITARAIHPEAKESLARAGTR